MAVGADELKAILGNVSKDCERMELVAIGGTALSLLGMKQATKDVDLLFLEPNDMKTFAGALKVLGYQPTAKGPAKYSEALDDESMKRLHHAGRVLPPFDLFYGWIVKAKLTRSVRKRLESIGTIGKLVLKVPCHEDLLLFKANSSRQSYDDFMDAKKIIDAGTIDWDVFAGEVEIQHKVSLKAHMYPLAQWVVVFLLKLVYVHRCKIPMELIKKIYAASFLEPEKLEDEVCKRAIKNMASAYNCSWLIVGKET